MSYRWDQAREVLEASKTYLESSADQDRLFLLECPADNDDWESMTSEISTEVLSRCIPLGELVSSVTSSTVDSARKELANMHSSLLYPEEVEFKFTEIDLKRSWPEGSIGPEITKHSLDKSWTLDQTINKAGSESDLLGEFELCFANLLLFSSVTSLEQYNLILRTVCLSKTALSQRASFCSRILVVLQVYRKSHNILVLTGTDPIATDFERALSRHICHRSISDTHAALDNETEPD